METKREGLHQEHWEFRRQVIRRRSGGDSLRIFPPTDRAAWDDASKAAMNRQEHWENIYRTKKRQELSWFSEHLDTSIQLITSTGVGKAAAIIDVGGGNSTLVDDLLMHGFV